ncbi:hypothetical protein HUW63_03535 [Myxococcus sp. AM001]|nr:hypothetical protein [Myxococcus sp. AM001]
MLLRVLVWGVSGILLLAVLAIVAFHIWSQRQYGPAIEQFRADVTAQVDFFCEQQALLGAEPWFHEPRPPGDAGPLLNEWLRVASGPPDLGESPLRLPRHLLLLQKFGSQEDWGTSDLELSSLDFGWMRQMHAFDHWNAIPRAAIPPGKPFDLMSASLPEFSLLTLWAKLRLRHAVEQGTPLEAVRDVRQLAWLAYRTDTLVGGMVAISLLTIEHKLHATLVNPPPDWRPLSPKQLKRFAAVLQSAPSFSSIASPVEVSRKARACQPAIGRCVGLVEAAMFGRFLEPYAKGAYRGAYAALKADSAASTCPTQLLAAVWEQGHTVTDEQARHGAGDESASAARSFLTPAVKVPIANQILSTTLTSLDTLRELNALSPAP